MTASGPPTCVHRYVSGRFSGSDEPLASRPNVEPLSTVTSLPASATGGGGGLNVPVNVLPSPATSRFSARVGAPQFSSGGVVYVPGEVDAPGRVTGPLITTQIGSRLRQSAPAGVSRRPTRVKLT